METFKPNLLYKLDYSGHLVFGDIPEARLFEKYKDGRRIGLLIEDDLTFKFDNLVRALDEQSEFDLLDLKTGYKYEVRTVSQHGANLVPSRMIGAGRSIDIEGVLKKFRSVDYFIFCCITDIPIIKVFSMCSKNFFVNRKEVITKLTPKNIKDIILNLELENGVFLGEDIIKK